MKLIRLIALILAMIIPCTFVSAFEFDLSDTKYDEGTSTVVAVYTSYEYSRATMLCYDVTKINGATADTKFVDMEATPIVGIKEQRSDGSFEFPIASDFSGRVVLMIGGQVETPIRMLLNIKDGELLTIEDVILEDFDAKNAERVLLGENETVEIKNNAKLMNAVIDAREGCVIIGEARLSGNIIFNSAGEVDVEMGNTVKIESENDDGTTNQGFIQKAKLNEGDGAYTITLKITGQDSDKAYNGESRSHTFTFKPIYSGNAIFGLAITNIPEGITLTAQ